MTKKPKGPDFSLDGLDAAFEEVRTGEVTPTDTSFDRSLFAPLSDKGLAERPPIVPAEPPAEPESVMEEIFTKTRDTLNLADILVEEIFEQPEEREQEDDGLLDLNMHVDVDGELFRLMSEREEAKEAFGLKIGDEIMIGNEMLEFRGVVEIDGALKLFFMNPRTLNRAFMPKNLDTAIKMFRVDSREDKD